MSLIKWGAFCLSNQLLGRFEPVMVGLIDHDLAISVREAGAENDGRNVAFAPVRAGSK